MLTAHFPPSFDFSLPPTTFLPSFFKHPFHLCWTLFSHSNDLPVIHLYRDQSLPPVSKLTLQQLSFYFPLTYIYLPTFSSLFSSPLFTFSSDLRFCVHLLPVLPWRLPFLPERCRQKASTSSRAPYLFPRSCQYAVVSCGLFVVLVATWGPCSARYHGAAVINIPCPKWLMRRVRSVVSCVCVCLIINLFLINLFVDFACLFACLFIFYRLDIYSVVFASVSFSQYV